MMSLFSDKERLIRFSLWLLIASFGLHLLYALIITPVFGDDAPYHLSWIEDFTRLRSIGQDYPRWIAYTFGGMGSPTFYFYPPLCYLIADTYYSLGIATSTYGLFHAVNASTFLLSAITCFLYLRNKLLPDRIALIGSLLYATALYRYVDAYTRAALGEHAAFAWIPLVLISVDLAATATSWLGRSKALVIAALGWSLLMLTNLPSTALTAIIVIPYGIILYGRGILRIWPAAVGAILGALMCSGYLLPLLHFKPFIQTENLWNFGVYLSQWHHLIIEIFEAETRKGSIQLSAFISAFLGFVMLYLMRRKTFVKGKHEWALISIGVVSLFFQIPFLSDPFWNLLAPLQLLQFSWRFSMGLVLFSAIAMALVLHRRTNHAELLLLGTASISLLFYLRFGFIILTYPTAPYMVEEYRRGAPEYINKYLKLQQDSVRTWAIAKMGMPIFSATEKIRVSDEYQNGDTLKAVIDTDAPTDLHIKRLWWPQWKFEYRALTQSTFVRAEVEPSAEGLIVVRNIPAGPVQTRLTIEESESEKNGKLFSLIGVTIFVSLCIGGCFLQYRRPSKDEA